MHITSTALSGGFTFKSTSFVVYCLTGLTIVIVGLWAVLASDPLTLVTFACFFLVGLGITGLLTKDSTERQRLGRFFLVSFAVCTLSTITLSVYIHSQQGIWVEDIDRYDYFARQWLEAWKQGNWNYEAVPIVDSQATYGRMIAGLYYIGEPLGGTTLMPALFILCLATALVAPLTYTLARQLTSERVASLATWLTIFSPEMILRSTILARDALFTAPILCLTLLLVRHFERPNTWWRWAGATLLSVLLGYLRAQYAIMCSVLVPSVIWGQFALHYLLRRALPGQRRRLLLHALATFLFLAIMVLQPGFQQHLGNLVHLGSFQQNAEEIVHSDSGDSGPFYSRRYKIPYPYVVPFDVSVAILQPYNPWGTLSNQTPDNQTVYSKLEALSGLHWYVLLPFCVLGWLKVLRTRQIELWPVAVVALIVIASVGLSQLGYIQRFRTAAIPPLILFAAIAIDSMPSSGRWIIKLWQLAVLGMIVVIAIAKRAEWNYVPWRDVALGVAWLAWVVYATNRLAEGRWRTHTALSKPPD